MKYLTILLAVVAAAHAPSLAQKSSGNPRLANATPPPADAAFWKEVDSGEHVLDVQIEVDLEAWNTMQPPRGRNQRSTYIRAKITIDGEQFGDAALRFAPLFESSMVATFTDQVLLI